jgi:hypothetical protein
MHNPLGLTLAATVFLTGAAWAALGADPVKNVVDRINAAHQQNYDALERAPMLWRD